ncbi:Phytosulfokine [Artemisia annua]|uniref:Phytosulfokine n=1 Tax=Artemisia annua TaxID=35608 RepID=A0A2U1KKB7_ARTAN|nr:Phytosulfokine [Artemisia annua]
MAELDDVGNEGATVIFAMVNRTASNTIWSVIQRLVVGAVVYCIWQERNIRRSCQSYKSEETVFNHIVSTIRLKLLGLKVRYSTSVYKAACIWDIPWGRSEHQKRMVEDLLSSEWCFCLFSMKICCLSFISWVLIDLEGTGFWLCNTCFNPFIGVQIYFFFSMVSKS